MLIFVKAKKPLLHTKLQELLSLHCLLKKIHLNKFNKVTLSNGLNFDYSN